MARPSPGAFPPRPIPLTPLIGRAGELAAIVRMLDRPDVRVVTILGPGGVGKTRLAQAVADHVAAETAQGVLLLRLETVREPDAVLPMVARALGLREHDEASALDTLAAHLRDRPLLLVLDNMEQILDAGIEIATLLHRAPALTVLATSRAPLNLSDEQLFPLAPLTIPTERDKPVASQIAGSPAVALFTGRAQAVQPSFALTDDNAPFIAAICRQLDGLPLAIELAAARVNVLSPRALLARLPGDLRLLSGGPVDAPARHRALTSTIAWSYDLLSQEEQRLFRGLGVFVSGCDVPAAERVAGTPSSGTTLDHLSALVDKSLVRPAVGLGDEPRFTMLETIREFALDRLAASEEDGDARARQLTWALDVAGEANEALRQGEAISFWLDRLEVDHGNLRDALDWATSHDRANDALSLAAMLWRFWEARGYFHEGTGWLERTLAAAPDAPPDIQAQALNNLANLLSQYGDARRAQQLYEESLRLRREIDDRHGFADTLNNLAISLADRGDYQQATALLEECFTLRRALGDEAGLILALANLGDVATAEGNLDQAKQLHQRALALRKAREDVRGIAYSELNLGLISLLRGDLVTARAHLRPSLETFRALGDKFGAAYALRHLALVAHQSQPAQPAVPLLRESLQRRVELGDRRGIAECLEGIATVAPAAAGNAVRLLAAAASIRRGVGIPLPAVERDDFDAVVADLRARLPEDEFAAAWAEGMSLTPEDAYRLALDDDFVTRDKPAPVVESPAGGLSEREVEIMRFVAQGMTNVAIAEHLYLSPRTVEAHLRRIYKKLNLSSRAAATRFAAEHGLLHYEDH